ncbi:MAG: 16S rRNA (cytosine(1402)-N(4))-methyltransferase RsmH [Candidatus Latescibacteria bacterium]|nr:16S rRNA (cytosine(1402)-N(4))-methyltransferase RsmH [Candidatus Latescibacterota bacterium]
MSFHVPVMLRECVEGVVSDPRGFYLDATVGGGGHSRAILQALQPPGRLIGVDRDAEALDRARQGLADFAGQVDLIEGRFGDLGQILEGREGLQGGLFDLGVSSHQIDEGGRGFSYRQDGPLDMRMEPGQGATAADLIADLSEAELTDLIRRYGEERQARRIARSIGQYRRQHGIESTADLRQAIEQTRPQHLPKTLARVFQALRIAVNDELAQLERGLEAVLQRLVSGGRLAVIAYHSLEDRLVKRRLAVLLKGCTCPPDLPVCACGKKPTFQKYGGGIRRASTAEVGQNRRARSAVLRVYEKL